MFLFSPAPLLSLRQVAIYFAAIVPPPRSDALV